MQTSSTGRLDFLDNLKVAVTLLVVAHHAGQPYGGSGGFWYFKSQQTTNLGPFFAVNAAFFMSLFFMISAYFLPASFDKKGAALFLKDRLKRIGIQLIFVSAFGICLSFLFSSALRKIPFLRSIL